MCCPLYLRSGVALGAHKRLRKPASAGAGSRREVLSRGRIPWLGVGAGCRAPSHARVLYLVSVYAEVPVRAVPSSFVFLLLGSLSFSVGARLWGKVRSRHLSSNGARRASLRCNRERFLDSHLAKVQSLKAVSLVADALRMGDHHGDGPTKRCRKKRQHRQGRDQGH